MSVIHSRECSAEVMLEIHKYSGYSIKQIEEVIDSAYAFLNTEIDRGTREPIRLPKLGSFQISRKRENNEIHNIPDGILNRKHTIGVYSNVNPKRIEELLTRYKNEFSKNK